MSVKLLYALEKNTNKVVFIKDVKNGLSCNCYCPECKSNLVAKNGGNENLKDYHFAHENNSSCSSGETYLHFLSKVVLSEMTEFFLPEGLFDEIQDYIGHNIGDKNKYFGKNYKIVNCYIEKKIQEEGGYIRPDIILELDIAGKTIPFLIEVAVNHFIEDDKFEYIKKHNLNCVEIDLNDLKEDKELWDKELLKKELCSKERQTWINQNVFPTKIKVDIEKHQEKIIKEIKNFTEYLKNKTIYFSGLDGFNFYRYKKRNLCRVYDEVKLISNKFNEEKFEYFYFEHTGFGDEIYDQYPKFMHDRKKYEKYLRINKAMYFFRYDNPLIYIENEKQEKFCIIFKKDTSLIDKLHKQKIDLILIGLNESKGFSKLENYLERVLFKSLKQLTYKMVNNVIYVDNDEEHENKDVSFHLLPYNRYEIEKDEVFNYFITNGIKIKQNNEEKIFIIKSVEIIALNEYDYCFEFTAENDIKVLISTTDKIKRIENKYKKLKIEYYLYHEQKLSLGKLRELFTDEYIPQKPIIN